jgi:hypothetical protein
VTFPIADGGWVICARFVYRAFPMAETVLQLLGASDELGVGRWVSRQWPDDLRYVHLENVHAIPLHRTS